MATGAGSIIATGVAAKKLVETVLGDLYGLAKSEMGFQLKKWKAQNHADTVYRRIRQLRLVKTIWQLEKEIDLVAFYYPSRVLVGTKRTVVNRLADLGFDGNVVIEGTAGQGKSILLRYLASAEFSATRRVPVFVELRRLRQEQTLVGFALQELQALGFDMTEEVFHFFAEKGRLLLFLDAFDELREEKRQDVLSEVESLIRRHEALRVAITSRPQSGASNSPLLRRFALCPLEGREYEQVIRRMAQDSKTSDAIISGIRKGGVAIANLLTTPLMVALLMVRYKIDQSIPENNVAFYDALFSLLLQRHDKTKAGYVRPRKSDVGDAGLERFFNVLCFLTRKVNQTSFMRSELYNAAREAAKITAEVHDVEKMLADILEITCLIVTDGDEYRFIHKSVQEYHAALFIKEQPDDSAKRFYGAMEAKWQTWQQELRFLELIDRYRYLKYFSIPALRSVLGVGAPLQNVDELSSATLIRICGEDSLTWQKGDQTAGGLAIRSTGSRWPTWCLVQREMSYVNGLFEITLRSEFDAEFGNTKDVTVHQLLDSRAFKGETERACREFCRLLLSQLETEETYVDQVEKRQEIFAL